MPDTIAWPTWLEPAEFVPTLVKNAVLHRSPFDQAPQVWAAPGEHWAYSLVLPPCPRTSPIAQRRTAFLNRIAAGAVRLQVPHFQHRSPHGSLRGAPVLAAEAAIGTATLSISGARSGSNLMPGGSFEIDSNADGLADGWSASSADGARVNYTSRTSYSAVDGSYQQYLEITAASTSADSAIVASHRPPVVPGQPYTLTADVRCNVAGKVHMLLRFYDSAGVALSDAATAPLPFSNYLVPNLVSHTVTAPAGAAAAEIMVRGINQVGEYFLVDVVHFHRGASPLVYPGPATLLAGDYIGAGGQLFEVQQDTTLDDAGAGVVPVNNRARVAIPSGSPVTWQAPTALMICPTARLPTSHRPGWQDAIALDLQEVWDA